MKYLLAAALVFCFGMLDSLYSRVDELAVAEADARAQQKLAAHYTALLAACLNGKSIQQEEITVDFRRRRK